ncbi:MAG: alpha/beta hydrolase fold domain-containing protein [Limisphaerales bacterium]
MRIAIFVIALLLGSFNADAAKKNKIQPPPDGVSVLRDIVYKQPFIRPLELDLYRPKNFKGRLPVVVWVHGGGWKNGSKNNCPAKFLAQHGFAVASIDYRLTHHAQWPAQIDDCRSAVRWLRKNAGKYRLNPNKIGAWGSSAGGHLVAILGTIDAPDGEEVSSRVQAACDWFGPSDLLTMPYNMVSAKRTIEQVRNSNGAKLLGAAVPDIPKKARHASALHHVSVDDPPFLVMHGDEDPGVPIDQSNRFAAALKKAKVDVTYHVVKGAGHGGKLFKTDEVNQLIIDFFSRTLKN